MVNYNSFKVDKTRKINFLVPAKPIAQHIDFGGLKQLLQIGEKTSLRSVYLVILDGFIE